MKNIHILPTDKPSRLYLVKDKLKLSPLKFTNDKETGWLTQNIYITSDEEIKEGDKLCWCINTIKNTWNKDLIYYQGAMPQYHYKGFKKIILTTDQDLIKDGVQAINDEFLEWFVTHPSYEEVKIKPSVLYRNGKYVYSDEIIIPKEEPKPFKQMEKLTEVDWQKFKKSPFPSKEESKQETLKLNSEFQKCINFNDKIYNKETLEEAAEKIYNEFPLRSESLNNLAKEKFIAGVKWQQERSYSKKEVNEILAETWNSCEDNEGETFTEARKRILGQFKNK